METLKTKPTPSLKNQVFEVLETDEAKFIFFGTNKEIINFSIVFDGYIKNLNLKNVSAETVLFRDYLDSTQFQNRSWYVYSFFSFIFNKDIHCNVYENKETTKESRLLLDNETTYEKIYMIVFSKK